jgi:hypothetical protein
MHRINRVVILRLDGDEWQPAGRQVGNRQSAVGNLGMIFRSVGGASFYEDIQ